MRRLEDEASITTHAAVHTVVDAAEPLQFARDLGGSLTHVLVAATGRALAAFASSSTDRASQSVGLAVASREREARLAQIPGTGDAPLPAIRDLVDLALDDPNGAASVSDGVPAIVVIDREAGWSDSEVLPLSGVAVLEAGLCACDPPMLSLTLSASGALVDGERPEDVLARIAHLVERPYRRLV